jgi:membrane-associated phospholipid phosphatase
MTDHARRRTLVRWLVVAAIGCAIGFVAFVLLVEGGRPGVDLQVAEWVATNRSERGIDVAKMISVIGSVVGIVPLALLIAVWLHRRDGWHPVRSLVLGCGGATALYLIVNVLIRSARPPMPLRVMDEVGWSFPSGHATQAVVFWPLLALLVVPHTARGRGWWLLLAVAVALVIGGSRIYLDVHWTTDVASGLLLGLAWLCAVLALHIRRELP